MIRLTDTTTSVDLRREGERYTLLLREGEYVNVTVFSAAVPGEDLAAVNFRHPAVLRRGAGIVVGNGVMGGDLPLFAGVWHVLRVRKDAVLLEPDLDSAAFMEIQATIGTTSLPLPMTPSSRPGVVRLAEDWAVYRSTGLAELKDLVAHSASESDLIALRLLGASPPDLPYETSAEEAMELFMSQAAALGVEVSERPDFGD